MEFYCVKCRKKVEVSDENLSYEDRGNRRIYRSKCPQCGTRTTKFGNKNQRVC